MTNRKVLIIAEAGVNHNGDLAIAKRLIDAAVDAGVDLVKFQTFKAEDLVSKEAKQAEYQKKNIDDGSDSQYEMLKRLELSEEGHLELIRYCEAKNIEFFSTAFDVKGLEYLNSLGFPRFKVPSGEITNYPYLKKLSEYGKPVILSTGMANLAEIKEALSVLEQGILKENITVLHCNTEYPTPMEDVNLRAMNTIAAECKVAVGYSDHTLGIEVPIAAVAMGAVVIEKHFTLDRSLHGPDHAASLEPNELKAMVQGIRNIEKAISGDGIKAPSHSELKNKIVARKSLHLIKDLISGHKLMEGDLVTLRPGDGVSPMEINQVIGRRLNRNLAKGTKLIKEYLK
ncbi:N-acetylneuraminate synthase [Algoriphagus sp. PAP.12]|uniref:N-acetylneuraminate synthase n=1 Tax=Algoriphagus sp. PAP.12 TaxID=2996678 RepID=UPI00227C4990|nr:N-acetylneuraminate synthase [Algoriphagus sp. PAP.12]